MNNFKLKDGKSGVFGDFKREAINELYCFLIQICFYHPSFSSRHYYLFLTKKHVVDLQESLFKGHSGQNLGLLESQL